MKRLPERIWVCVDKEHGNIWSIDEGIEGTEYIRVDVHKREIKKLERLVIKIIKDRQPERDKIESLLHAGKTGGKK